MLYIVATPIGSLEDLTIHALKILKSVDYTLAEDTRRAHRLFSSYEITTPLVSYHKFKEQRSVKKIIDDLKEGKKIALISDAGTPCINDPGQILVDACINESIGVTSIPGPSSVINALVLSGFPFEKFQFIGFLPKKPLKFLEKTLMFQGVTVCFESPNRVVQTLRALSDIDPDIELAVIKEMTKMFETIVRGKALDLLKRFSKEEIKGEFVFVIKETPIIPKSLTPEEVVESLQSEMGLDLKSAIKAAAKLLKKKKSDIYHQCRS